MQRVRACQKRRAEDGCSLASFARTRAHARRVSAHARVHAVASSIAQRQNAAAFVSVHALQPVQLRPVPARGASASF
eukprot:2742689-Pleurochrysis_carterae.AAC.1